MRDVFSDRRRARPWEVSVAGQPDKFPYCRICEFTQEVAAYENHCQHCPRVLMVKDPAFIEDCKRMGCSVNRSKGGTVCATCRKPVEDGVTYRRYEHLIYHPRCYK